MSKERKLVKFGHTNSSVGWASWTWNTVKGCLHECPYCYAAGIVKARNLFASEGGFAPGFQEHRLQGPALTTSPITGPAKDRRVFVSSMGDMWGDWVPQDWIDRIMTVALQNPQWTYIFLTKNPERLLTVKKWPTHCWVGTTVDCQRRVAKAEEVFSRLNVPIKFACGEPLLEKVTYARLDVFDILIIGGQTAGSVKYQPDRSWTLSLMAQAKEAGVAVYFKDNMDMDYLDSGIVRKEYPVRKAPVLGDTMDLYLRGRGIWAPKSSTLAPTVHMALPATTAPALPAALAEDEKVIIPCPSYDELLALLRA